MTDKQHATNCMIIIGITCILTMNEDIKHLIGEVPEPVGWHRCPSNVIFQAFWMNMNLIDLLMNFTYVQTLFGNLKYTILCIVCTTCSILPV